MSFLYRAVGEEYQILANSWRYSQSYSNKLFFASVDYDEAADVFKSVSSSFKPFWTSQWEKCVTQLELQLLVIFQFLLRSLLENSSKLGQTNAFSFMGAIYQSLW